MPVARQCEIVCDVDKMPVDIQETFMKYKTIKEWAYIVHDKDDTRPHYHIYLNFGSSGVDFNLVSSWFQIPVNFVNKIKGKKTDMLMYLTHSNETQKNKHQYDPSEVKANFDFVNEIENFLNTINANITVAIMGCVVNGPGEAKHADIGIAGGIGEAVLFKHGEIIRKIKEENIIKELKQEILNLI